MFMFFQNNNLYQVVKPDDSICKIFILLLSKSGSFKH